MGQISVVLWANAEDKRSTEWKASMSSCECEPAVHKMTAKIPRRCDAAAARCTTFLCTEAREHNSVDFDNLAASS